MPCVYFIVINSLIFLHLLQSKHVQGVGPPRHIDGKQFNIVWFMTEPLNSGSINSDVSVRDLNFCRVVKPCTARAEDAAPCENEQDSRQEERKTQAKVKKQNACDCRKILDKNINSFMDWVGSNKQMSIASIVVKLPEKPSNSIVKDQKCEQRKLFKLPANREMNPVAYHKKGNRFTNKYKVRQPQRRVYPMRRDTDILDVPVFELFNPKPKIIFNQMDRRENDRYNINKRNAVTILNGGSDDVDSYEDSAKNDAVIFDGGQVESCPQKMPNIFDLMRGNLSPPKLLKQESFDLFKTVVNTMGQLVSVGNPHGFAVIIKGGRFEDLDDQTSPLARSINYAKCRTNDTDTLIVLSMVCPEERHSAGDDDDDGVLPVFCTGRHCEELHGAEELKDLFDIIRRGLEEGCSDEDAVASERRLARALIETVYYDDGDQEELSKKAAGGKMFKRDVVDYTKEMRRLVRNSCETIGNNGKNNNNGTFWKIPLIIEGLLWVVSFIFIDFHGLSII